MGKESLDYEDRIETFDSMIKSTDSKKWLIARCTCCNTKLYFKSNYFVRGHGTYIRSINNIMLNNIAHKKCFDLEDGEWAIAYPMKLTDIDPNTEDPNVEIIDNDSWFSHYNR